MADKEKDKKAHQGQGGGKIEKKARKPKGAPERVFYMGVMLLAGPSVLIDNATRSFRKKGCSNAAYIFAVGLTVYWSFALGLALITVTTKL